MKLLSRVAERLYWLARYLERTENTARLIKSYNNLIMDIPIGSEPSWMTVSYTHLTLPTIYSV